MAGTVNKMETAGGLLEDVREYVKRKGHGDAALCLVLRSFWPVPGDKSPDMSGMICFVALFRMMFWSLDTNNREAMGDLVRDKGFLRFALSNFGADNAKEREACKLMHDALTEQLGCQPTFDRLAESDMLRKTLWAHDMFRLYRPMGWRRGPESPEWDWITEEKRGPIEAKRGMITWDTSKHSSISEAVKASDGFFRGRLEGMGDDSIEFSLRFRAPLVARVKVLFRDKIEGFCVSDIASIPLQAVVPYSKQIGLGNGGTEAPRTIEYRKVPGHAYRLMAIVKLRAEGEDQDDVRIFDGLGGLVLPSEGRPGLEKFCSREWSIRDQRHDLMLCYSRMGEKVFARCPAIVNEYGRERDTEVSADTPEPGREPAHSKGQDSDQTAQGKGKVRGEVGRAQEDGIREPVDSEGQDTGEDEEAETLALDQPRLTRAHSLTLPLGGVVGSWPFGGFADNDSAAPYLVHVIRHCMELSQPCLSLDHVKVVRNPEMGASDPRTYRQVARLYELEADCNFWFPRPGSPDSRMGKVDCSAVGLAIVLRALRTVVLNYDDARSTPSLEEQTQSLTEAGGVMDYVQPSKDGQTFYFLAEPFSPQDIRSVLEALQLAARHSTAGHVLFYVDPVDFAVRHGAMSAFLDVHPIVGRED